MVGAIAANLHEGSRSEYLAQYVLASFGTAVAVPHHEDSGIDLVCTLTERIGNRAWPRSHYSVQVKSTLDPWVFEGAESVRWLVEHPLPLLLCGVDKSSARIRIWHTSPRFYVWSHPPLPARVELVPETAGEGRCTLWQGGHIFSLDAPIVDITIQELLSDSFHEHIKVVLDFWIQFDVANLRRLRNGIRQFTMPDGYRTNTIELGGFVSQGITAAKDFGDALQNIRELVSWVSTQLHSNGDITGAVIGAMFLRHFFSDGNPKDDILTHDTFLHAKVNKLFGRERYMFDAVDWLNDDLAAKLASIDQPSPTE